MLNRGKDTLIALKKQEEYNVLQYTLILFSHGQSSTVVQEKCNGF
jgi:hypothetical protein